MIINRAEKIDLPTILTLQRVAFEEVAELLHNYDIPPLKETLTQIEEEFSKGIILKCTSDNHQIVGSIRGCYLPDTTTCYVGRLIVDPLFQNRGIGTSVLAEIEKFFPSATKFLLYTGEITPNTAHLYTKVGYQTIHRKEMGGVMMLIMEKSID